MATIDTSELLIDSDFTDGAILISRAQTINEFGETELITTSMPITVVVQNGAADALNRVQEGAQLIDSITVWYRVVLKLEAVNGYADIIVWRGRNYQVKTIGEDFQNFGVGFTKAVCEIMRPNNDA